MNYAVDSANMKLIDDYTVEKIKIPALLLMERAALHVAETMKGYLKKTDRILVVCGPGNNGGDGIAAGRILFLQGYRVAILFPGDEAKTTPQTQTQLTIARNLNMPFENTNKLREYNIIIDAIFGVGLSRPVTGEYENVISEINSLKCKSGDSSFCDSDGIFNVISRPQDKSGISEMGSDNIFIFSIDVPSGISADSGRIMNIAVKADHTITFGFMKQGLLLYPGAQYAGEVTVANIGFPECVLRQVRLNTFYFDKKDLRRLPERKEYSNKGTYGRVLIIAGSEGMSGAAYLSAKAAYKTGAGLVKVLTSKENRVILQTSLPEAVFAAYDEESPGKESGNKEDPGREDKNKEDIREEEWREEMAAVIRWASVIVIGPGLGQSEMAQKLLELTISEAQVPLIIDADGLNMLAGRMDSLCTDTKSRWEYLSGLLPADTVLTPHVMEFSRLTGLPVSEITDNMIDTDVLSSYNKDLIIAVKDARTVVARREKRYINVSGNNGMATGGSGDVLTGIIAALIAQKMLPFQAVCLAVYIHGLSGDAAAEKKNVYSLMAGDVIDSIETVIKGPHQLIEGEHSWKGSQKDEGRK